MTATLLKRYFDPLITLDLRVWQNFAQLGQVVALPKETVLKPSHATEKQLHFLLEGSGGLLLWHRQHFVCVDIALEHEFLADYASFTMQQPSELEVRLFEDSTLFSITHARFQQVFAAGAYGHQITKAAAEHSLLEKQQQQIDLLTKSAKTRYLELLDRRPGLARLPLKYLASYLGITPQSLSRIRAEKR